MFFLFSSINFSFAKENNQFPSTAPSGITPDSFLYPLDQLSEKVSLFFSFNSEKKATKAIAFTNERAEEMALMALNNVEKGLEKASLSRQKEIFQDVLPHAQPNIKEKLEQEISASEQSRKAAISSYSPPVSSNLKQFEQNLQSAAEKIKANCPAPNFSSWHFQIMCTTQLNKTTPTNEEYHELGGPCPWEESGKIEVYRAESEIIRYLGTADGKSKEINCEVSCGSNNCPLSENEEAKRKNCPQPIYRLITLPWPENEELKSKLKADIDQSIAEECELRGTKFGTDGRRLTETEEKDCQIIEGKCDYTVIKNLAGKDQLARACCCSCARPERENLSYGQGLVNLLAKTLTLPANWKAKLLTVSK